MSRPLLLVLLLLSVAGADAGAQSVPVDSAVRDLRDAFQRGWMVEDRNGDDVVDFVRARVLLPLNPAPAAVAAAANVSARLAWETSALDLGIAAADDGAVRNAPVVVIAREDLSLGPGEGAITALPPDARLQAGGVQLTGGDATGLLAAAGYFSSRYPSLWTLEGPTWLDVVERVQRLLANVELPADSVRIARIVVDASQPGVRRATVRVHFSDSAAMRRAADRLRSPRPDSVAPDSAQDAPQTTLTFPGIRRIDVTFEAPFAGDTVRISNDVRDIMPGAAWPARDAPDFTLSDLYTIRGLYRDTNEDLVPDRTEAHITLAGADASASLIDLAARISLETAGARLPLVTVSPHEDAPQRLGIPIVAGLAHDQLSRLRADERLGSGGAVAGEGIFEFVRAGFGGKHGLVLTGGDARGLEAITAWVAETAPYLHTYGKGNYRLADVEVDVRRFFQAREAPGQTALAIAKLNAWLGRLQGRDLTSIGVEIAAKQAPAGLDAHVSRIVERAFPQADVRVTTHHTGFGAGDTVFTQAFEIPWEVDSARSAVRAVISGLSPGGRGSIEVRVSEAPDVRAALAAEIRALLEARGLRADAWDVVVLNAYKQGYSWLHDVVLPRLRGHDIGRIDIGYRTLKDSDEVRWQTIASDTRWLQELYPIDAVLARALGIPDSLVTFTPRQDAAPIYEVRVTDADGDEILRDTFDPKYVVRPFFDLFPEYEQVRVTTGWVTAVQDGDTLADRRILTDAEAFWDVLQTDTYARMVEYVMDIQDGRPAPANAPYFDEFRVDLALSEPDHRIGIDEEVISSLEALHEDIYFETLTLFDLIGGRYGVGGLDYPGRVLPWIRRVEEGGPGHARISLTGKKRGVPELVLTYAERGQEPVRMRYPLSPLEGEAPKLRGVAVRAGEEGIARLLFDVVAIDSVDRFDEMRERAAEAAIDRQLLPAPLLSGMLEALRFLHEDGLYMDALAFDRVDELAIRFVLEGDSASVWRRQASLPRSRAPRSTRNPVLLARGWTPGQTPLVQWQTPIPPAENDSLLARIATFPTANVYFLLESILGHNVFAVDFLPPHDARYISQAKRNALKPTLFLSGRQHANEVSSTSHILRLAELLATDSAHTELLKRVNVVLHPITNPDGAQLAWEMQRENPDFMLHAGYLGALGVDATAGASSEDPLYPESRARPELNETWLPDIAMNLHGYPSHEWVQVFAGYSAWVRSRTGPQRSWWAPRGWFVPGFSWVDDPAHPEYREAQFAVLDSIAAAITGHERVQSMSERMYARYAKYGRQDVENFREHFHNGMLIYLSLRGRDSIGTGVNSPRITWFSATTEAPDETARGEWLELVASAGLAHTSALLRYLAQGENRIEHESAEYRDAVVRSVWRKKPVLPRKAEGG